MMQSSPLRSYLLLLLLAQSSAAATKPHVVGAGLGRTGTMSFKTALEKLDLGPIFHMEDSIHRIPEINPYWRELSQVAALPIVDGTAVWPPRFADRNDSKEVNKRVQLLADMLGVDNQTKNKYNHGYHYHGNLDFPLFCYYLDLIQVYEQHAGDGQPVKVVLTSRDTGQKWAKSALGSILNWHPSRRQWGTKFVFATMYRKGDDMLEDTFFRFFPRTIRDGDVDLLADMHDSYNHHVRESMAAYATARGLMLDDIFLDYQVKQGWDPLCAFLNVSNEDCPRDEPFPHINDHASYVKALRDVNRFGYMLLAASVVAIIAVVALGRYLVHRFQNHYSAVSTQIERKKSQ